MRLTISTLLNFPIRFQSTHPLRDATVVSWQKFKINRISIHAPLTGCDDVLEKIRGVLNDFNPRTPYGMRPFQRIEQVQLSIFQSTHPLRDATFRSCMDWNFKSISIHAPLTGCDNYLSDLEKHYKISIHAPLTGCDMKGGTK